MDILINNFSTFNMLTASKMVYNGPSLYSNHYPKAKRKIYIFLIKHLGVLFFLYSVVKAAEAGHIRTPPVKVSCKAVVSIVLVSQAAVLWDTKRPPLY